MHKTQCFLNNLSAIYPNLPKANLETFANWQNLLLDYSPDDILKALRTWHKKHAPTYYPTPKEFSYYLTHLPKKTHPRRKDLPFNPETYLMEQDIKNQTCTHLYPDYANAVRYILSIELQKHIPKELIKTYSYSERYSKAVELGLFANFHQTLETVSKSGVRYA